MDFFSDSPRHPTRHIAKLHAGYSFGFTLARIRRELVADGVFGLLLGCGSLFAAASRRLKKGFL